MNTTPSSSDNGKLRLVVQIKEHVPSFKNGKMLCRGRLITHPKKQKWMEKAAASIESQLRSWLLTRGTGMETGQSLRSLTLTSLPLDDSLVWIGVTCGSWRKVKKGEEGAVIEIERLG
jgi:hypothetical protein